MKTTDAFIRGWGRRLLAAVASCTVAPLAFADTAGPTARSYVQNGLIAQWDGIENAGWGVHDPNAAKPVELVSGIETDLTGTMPAGDRYFTFGSGYLHFNSEAIRNAVNAGGLTVEIVVKETGSLQGNGGFVAFGNSSRGFWVYQSDTIFITAYSYHAAISGEYTDFGVKARTVTTLSYLLSSSTADSTFGINGAYPYGNTQINRHTTDMADTDCYLGTLAGNWLNRKAKAHVFSIRVYTRKLSKAEVAANGEIDRVRFGISPATGDDALFQPADAGETARSYVQDGLIAQWDGIENAGWGLHDASAAKPVELISGINTELTGTMAADDMSFAFGSGSLTFKSAAIMAAINAGAATVEIVASKNGAYRHNGGFFSFGENQTRGFWLYQQNESFCNACSYHGNNSQYTVIAHNLDGTNTLSFALSNILTNQWYLGGVAAGSFLRRDTDVAADGDCCIGMLLNYNFMAVAKVFSIRIYGRTLTTAEIAKNAAIDRRRFGGGTVSAASYVRSGLIAQWDGAENKGLGLHEVCSVHPQELASGYVTSLTNSVPADGKAFLLGSGYLKFQSPEIIGALNAGHATVELVAAKDGAYGHNGGFVAFGHSTRAFWLYQQREGFLRCVSYHAARSGAINDVYKNIEFDASGTNSFSFLLADSSATSSYNTNGFHGGSVPRSTTDTPLNSDCYIGLLGDYNTKPNAKVFSVRVYDRLLTSEELESNQIADRLRFNLHEWTASSAPTDGANARIRNETVVASASVDLSVLAIEKGGVLNLPQEDVTVGTHVLLTNGVAVARGGYTGTGRRGTRVPWLVGPGLLRVGGGLSEVIPGANEFLYSGVTIIVR